MEQHSNSSMGRRALWIRRRVNGIDTTALLAVGICLLLLVALVDAVFSERHITAEGPPNFSLQYLLRSLGIALASFLCIVGLTRATTGQLQWDRWGVAYVVGSALFTIGALALLLNAPNLFSQLSLEDGLVEWGSAVLLFAASVVFLTSFYWSLRVDGLRRWITWLLLFASLGLLLIALEEISWFQRVIGFETPPEFHENLQHEMNLHNFRTDLVENAYYFGAFVFFVVAPLFKHTHPQWLHQPPIEALIPKPYMVAAAALIFAFNVDMWDVIYIQVAFFGSVTALLWLAYRSTSSLERAALLSIATLACAAQLLFLNSVEVYQRIWEVTEYKEFLIPLALVGYALDVRRTVRAGEQ